MILTDPTPEGAIRQRWRRFAFVATTGVLLVGLARGAMAVAGPSAAVSLAVDARALQPGEVVVLTVTTARPATSVAIEAFGERIPAERVDDTTWRAFAGIDLDWSPGPTVLLATARHDGTIEAGDMTVEVAPKSFPTRRLRVAPSFVTPSRQQQARITADARLLAESFSRISARAWEGPFVRPVPGPANSRFGSRSIFNGRPRAPHAGADFMSGTGTPVRAPNAGLVTIARDLFFTGHTVVIDHGMRVFSLLAHLSRIDVEEGATVTAGDVVGAVGATGRVTGPHLHWSVRVGNARVDPLSLLAVAGAESTSEPPALGAGRLPD